MSGSIDPIALLGRVATTVLDPLTGESVADAGVLGAIRMDEAGRLRFDLVYQVGHSKEQRKHVEESLLSGLRDGGFDGPVFPFARLGTAPTAPTGPAHGEAPRPLPPKKEDPVPGMSGPGVQAHGGPVRKQPIPGVQHVICVASGKGGVGKSTVATNLAVSLMREGYAVGLLDADVYGPSLPTMMNVSAKPMATEDNLIIPVMAYGVKCLSVGLMVPQEQAIIWRGPMVMGLVRQFLQQTEWGELDFLVIDLPPGTGDAQLTLIQAVDLSGAIIVTTPQTVALVDAVRGISMFQKLDVPLLGLVENMAWYELPDGTRDYVFGDGGGVALAAENGTEVLGRIPLQSRLRESGDAGRPIALGDGPIADAFRQVARAVAAKLV